MSNKILHYFIFRRKVRPFCLRYETDLRKNSNSSNSIQEIEVSFAGNKLVFELSGQKKEGFTGITCRNVATYLLVDETQSKDIRIRQKEGVDDWGVKTLHVQKYPDAVEYEIYSLDKNEPRFWVDGDEDNCHGSIGHDGYPCCPNGQWCDLEKISGNIIVTSI